MATSLKFTSHDTPAGIYDDLARVFTETVDGGHRWVTFVAEGVELTFFATAQQPESSEA